VAKLKNFAFTNFGQNTKLGTSNFAEDGSSNPSLAKGEKRRVWLDERAHKGSIAPFSLNNLRGNPLKLINLIYLKSKYHDGEKRVTPEVRMLELMNELNLSRDSVRTALRFLLKNKIIERVAFRAGRSGYSVYEIELTIFKELESK
jgi:hypothetical protein